MSYLILGSRRRPPLHATPTSPPWNAPIPLHIPTYDGSNDLLHTSAVDMGPGETFGGHRFWLAATPYHNHDILLENPCIWRSDDPFYWTEPAPGVNPVFDTPPGPEYNSDVDIAYSPDDGLMHMWWRCCLDLPENLTAGTGWVEIRHSSSADGITWTPYDVALSFENLSKIEYAISPSIVRAETGLWYMFTLETPGGLWRREATSPAGPWSEPTQLLWPQPDGTGRNQWHLEVLRDSEGIYRMLVATGTWNLWAASSRDGLTWHRAADDVIKARPGKWDDSLYRSTFTEHEDGEHFRVWYCSRILLRVGYTIVPKSEWPDPPA